MDYKNIKQKQAEPKPVSTPAQKSAIVSEGDIVKKNQNAVVKGATDFGDTLLTTVLKPALQRTVMELVRATCQEFTRAIEKKIFGREVFGDMLFTSAPLGTRPRTNYSRITRDPYAENYGAVPYQNRNYRLVDRPPVRDVKAIGFSSFEAAQRVLQQMEDDIKETGMISVGDYYTYCGESTDYTDFKFGWTNLNGVQVTPDRHGNYSISLPVPRTLG